MAVSEEFREAWLECEEEFGKNIEAGDIAVLDIDHIDQAVTLPAVKFTAPYNPNAENKFDSYVHVPMVTFKKPIDDLAAEVSEATANLVEVKEACEDATDDANDAARRCETAITGAENVDADLTGMTVTITDRNGQSRSVNIGFEIAPENVYASKAAMIADAANILAGKFCMIATTDPTATDNATLWSRNSQPASAGEQAFTFLSDLDQASSSAWADWLNNYKPTIEGDHTRAEQDHSTAVSDHTTAGLDHTQAGNDHTRAEQDHTTAGLDHTQAGNDHTRAEQDHTTADQDHTQADNDHTRADNDHTTADNDHTTADNDHTRADNDHTTADGDHTTAGDDHTRADSDHTESELATSAANGEANRAKAFNDHPWEIRSDGFIWVWDETHDNGDGTYGAMVRTNKMIINFDDLTPEQQAAMVQEFLSRLTFDETPTANSPNPVTSRGIKAALDLKQDNLTFASDQLCIDAAAEISFVPVTVEEPSGE